MRVSRFIRFGWFIYTLMVLPACYAHEVVLTTDERFPTHNVWEETIKFASICKVLSSALKNRDRTTDRMLEFDVKLNISFFWIRSRESDSHIKKMYPAS